ncbi:probable carboxylesterase 12 [Actinidia eriantha]|uniref:probable carboxylesterase 12 n=1 Tax=Actinidia eriantha TaxID=165200 RepID=UPI0025884BCE|nr:probable carboxylesterase 12 [Actinidia eriantha]XP_057493823.1 probable carboxylesterase 12 [Actinidia eriantha]
MDSELTYELPPFIRVYKDGKVERLMGTEIVPPSSSDPATGVQSKDIVISPETGVSARLYKPKTIGPNKKLPLLVYFHGGAFFVQTAFSPTYQHFLNSLVTEANLIVVSVDYRRAPEHPLPIGYDDSWAAVKWAVSQSTGGGREAWLKDHVDFDLMFFGGDSAGANIAHNMAIRVGSEGLDGGNLVGIVMMHPYFWGKDPIGSEETSMEVRADIERFWLLTCPSTTGLDDPWLNPASDPKLSCLGCKRVLVFVAERDVLRDRGWFYCEALGKSGWSGEVEIVEAQGEDHVFHLEKPNCEKGKDMVKKMASFVNQDKGHGL